MADSTTRVPQLCPTCSQGQCPYRDGIYCRTFICAMKRDNEIGKAGNWLMGILNGLRQQSNIVSKTVR